MLYFAFICVFLIISSKCDFIKESCSDETDESSCTAMDTCVFDTIDNLCKCFNEESIDILFVVDASRSISGIEWSLTLDFVKYAIETGISTQSRVGILKFNSLVEEKYKLSDNQDRSVIASVIDSSMGDPSGNTHTRDAIQKAIDVFKRDSNTNTDKKILVLVTDGNPYPETQNPTTPDNLRDDLITADITAIGILVGNDLDKIQLELLFDRPQKEIYQVSDFDELGLARDFLDTYICNGGPKKCGCSDTSTGTINEAEIVSRRRRMIRKLLKKT